jgi:hypothetical protein
MGTQPLETGSGRGTLFGPTPTGAYLMKAVFLDRDGTIIHEKPGVYLSDPKKVRPYKSAVKALQLLEKKGFKTARIKNTLANEDAPYRGVNCVIQAPDETMFELQFHTPKSLEVKEVNHKLYEEQRLDDTPEERKEELGRIMSENCKSIPTPEGLDKIGSYNNIQESLQRRMIYV